MIPGVRSLVDICECVCDFGYFVTYFMFLFYMQEHISSNSGVDPS